MNDSKGERKANSCIQRQAWRLLLLFNFFFSFYDNEDKGTQRNNPYLIISQLFQVHVAEAAFQDYSSGENGRRAYMHEL
jgi:hypothetical protein